MGIGHYAELRDEEFDFSDNFVTTLTQFDHANLFACSHLNLRCSLFISLLPDKLYSLVYIDISFSKIVETDFRNNNLLIKLVKD